MESEADVARWMVAHVLARRTCYQVDLVRGVAERFGPQWVDLDKPGRSAFGRRLRSRFRTEHGGAIRWDPTGRCWDVYGPRLPRGRTADAT